MIKVLSPGLFSTIQDMGRFGYRDKGVPVSGAMDAASAQLANMLLGNNSNDAVMELTMKGPRLMFNCNTCIVITGALLNPAINNAPAHNNKVYDIQPGDILSFGGMESGLRAYLAVKNGFKTDVVMNSRSQYESITGNSSIRKGDTIEIDDFPYSKMRTSNTIIRVKWMQNEILQVYKGPEYDLLSDKQKNELKEIVFTVANENNRMACQLDGELSPHSLSIYTSATLPGTVQFTPSGKLIVLMKDAQTTGGYPRILQLTEEAICILAQKPTGENVRFTIS